MANNSYVNKVQYGGTTVIDITDTTAEENNVLEGEVFYKASGARSVGTLGNATQSTAGLMSAADKTKLDQLDVITKTVSTPTSIASFSDGADGLPLKALKVGIEPVQDLHGYDYPWPAGGWKNLFDKDSVSVTSGSFPGDLSAKSHFEVELAAGTYTISGTGYTLADYIKMIVSNSDGTSTHDGVNLMTNGTYTSHTFDIAIGEKLYIYTTTSSNVSTLNTFASNSKTQIESGSTATDYAPYSNICPITGWTGAKVTRMGKNLADLSKPWVVTGSNTTYESVNDGTTIAITNRVSGTWHWGYKVLDAKLFYGKTITLSGKLISVTNSRGVIEGFVNLRGYKDGTQVWQCPLNIYALNTKTTNAVTLTDNFDEVRLCLWGSGGTSGGNTPAANEVMTYSEIQIEYGSEATDFEPCESTIYSLTFPISAGTVYGGTLDVKNGTLTVDRAEVDLGTLEWTYSNTTTPTFITPLSTIKGKSDSYKCLMAEYTARSEKFWTFAGYTYSIRSGNNYFNITADGQTDAAAFKTAMSGKYLVYELATPIVYQLTPVEVRTLLGSNNIWADTGNILDLSYLCNTGLAYESLSGNLEKIRQIVDERLMTGTVYGFHIDGSESDPEAAVTYLEDAVGKIPAHMDYASGTFDYGSWKNAFFMPRPAMLRPDGTVDCYLDPNDHSRREDGTESHIAHLGDVEASTTAAKAHAEGGYFVIGNVLYRATAAIAIGDTITIGTNCEAITNVNAKSNAMVEWGRNGKKIWYKIVPDAGDDTSASVYIADYQVDGGYHAWSFINNAGNMVDHFYTPMYFGTIVNDGTNDVLRSLSGASGANRCKSKTAAQEVEMARRNGSSLWDIEVYADIILINLLLVLMGKSLDTQTVYGEGLHTSGTDAINNGFVSGQHDAQGMFFGTNSGAAATYYNASKVFFMENYWGYMWRRIQGLIANDRVTRHKLTRGTADGSSATDYVVSTTGSDYSGYIQGGIIPSASGTYVGQMQFNENEFTPKTAGGTSMDASHYYCDGLWTNTGCRFTYRGGASNDTARVGAFYLALYYSASVAGWNVGAGLSCKP